MGMGHMGHQLRVTEPAIGHHQRGWQVEAASAQGRQALIKPDLRPAELGAATSPGTISLPSPMTTSSSTPSMPSTTRLCCPLHHVPTNSSLLLYVRKTESSSTHVHCQRLRVASLIVSMWRQSDPRTS